MKDFRLLKTFSLILLLFLGCSKSPQELKEDADKSYDLAIEYFERGYSEKAEELFIKVIQIENEIILTDYSPESYLYLGLIATEKADYNKALSYYESGKNLFKQKFNRKREGLIENNIGNIYAQLGQFSKAGIHFRNALGISQLSADKEGEAVANLNIGSLYSEMRDFQQAFNYYNKAYDSYKIIEDIQGEIISSNKIGEAFLRYGAVEQALESFDFAYQSAKDFRISNLIPPIINNAGIAYYKLGNFDNAISTFENGLNILLQNNEDPISLWTFYNNIADVYFSTFQYSKALTEYKNAVKIAEKYGEGLQAGIIKLKIGESLYLDGKNENDIEKIKSAEKQFSDLIILFEKIEFKAGLLEAYSGLAITNYSLGNFDKAYEYLKSTNNLLTVNNYGILNNITEHYVFLPNIFNHSRFYDILIKKGKFNELFENSFKWKKYENDIFINKLNNFHINNINDKNIFDSLRSIEREVSFLKFGISNEKSRFGNYQSSARLKNLNNLFNKKIIDSQSKKYLPDYYFNNNNLNINSLKNKLKSNQAVLTFFISSDKVNVLIFTKDGINLTGLEINPEGLNRQTLSLIENITNNDVKKFEELSKGFYFSLIKPIEKFIKDKVDISISVMESETGKISFLPFHSLIDEKGNYFSENYNISYFGGKANEKTIQTENNLVVYDEKFKNKIQSITNIKAINTSKNAKENLINSTFDNLYLLNPVFVSLTEPVTSYIEMYSDSISIPELNFSIGEFSAVNTNVLYVFSLYYDIGNPAIVISNLFQNKNIIINKYSISNEIKFDLLKQLYNYSFNENNFYKNISNKNNLSWISLFNYKKF